MRNSSFVKSLCVLFASVVLAACGPSGGGNDNNDQNNNQNGNQNQNDNQNQNGNQNNNNVIPPGCGDGVIQFGEICDCGDGTIPLPSGCPTPNSDAPDSYCRLNCQYPSCGDGIKDSGEECDLTDFGGASCASLGGTGDIACTASCTLDTSGCSICGNGICEGEETMQTCSQDCGILQVATGGEHSCALLGSGTVRCWGDNTYGQLGDGSYTASTSPRTVVGLSNAVDLACGSYHTCAVRADKTVVCWGQNEAGQLGNQSQIGSTVPVQVASLTNVGDITAGNEHTCAVDSSGAATVKCWGANYNGQLGNDSMTAFFTSPVSVVDITGAFGVTAGAQHTCALVGAGAAYCWGNGGNGRLGNNSSASSRVPVSVSGAAGLTRISAGGQHTCGVLGSGVVKCWGNNTYGQLGDGNTGQDSWVPVEVTGLAGGQDVGAGTGHTCAVLSGGTAKCWGLGTSGQLGNGSSTSSSTLVNVSATGLGTVLDTHRDHTCVTYGSTGARCWGVGTRGQLGDGGMSSSNVPVTVGNL
ncbi:MAG: hypothetical protein RBU30_17435 [Polyangia bacterium]|jgi:alpha-tubulin suppressor-like RCC1 family protein|nr:hypothetical protein [Polyangia bacterium]